ncbi:GspE/PulE family protein [Ferrimonas aestuarii]|uniref:Type II/IV secretion system protein n=1 Tax=Ferrimonas aestuarii TaxID=2569539 RepID=A0A4U1BLT8_9GAMM|nr:GspE/PulE family protein [Ferrimonas aestuarii]TKB53942.1 type II/IV secretion system protein [Ferrimonas aestuarii]
MSDLVTILRHFDVTSSDLEKAKLYQAKYGGHLEQLLVNMGALPEDQLINVYHQLFDYPFFNGVTGNASAELADKFDLNLEFLQQRKWYPVSFEEQRVQFATATPLDREVRQYLTLIELPFDILLAEESDLQGLSQQSADMGDAIDDVVLSDLEEDKLRELATEAPTVNLLNGLIARALKQGASDMHIEPQNGRYRVRYRVDGVLHEVEQLPRRLQLAVLSRLKILSGMDIAERRRPQDGKIEMKIANIELDIRVSALPLNDGESMVMRFLRKDSVTYDMDVLGLSADTFSSIKEDLQHTAGVILLTGPTGSGKTTTLYTFLNELNGDDVKIITLEDPVEYQLDGVNQVQVQSDIGFDFSAGLRSIVRQDPDVIMVGEIRDQETARIAMQSALTGHLVFSTVHTNDAPSAYTRLIDLGAEEYLLNAAIVSIIAQRLARKICPHCSVPHPDAQELIEKYKLVELAQRMGVETIDLRQSKGCDHCNHNGYRGRMALIEYLRCDDTIRAIPKDAHFIGKAREHNRQQGRRTLMEDGLYRAMLGQTTIDEAIRVSG